MKVLVTGARGQLGAELKRTVPDGVELSALDREGLDIGDRSAVMDWMGSHKPDVVVNAAGYTAVDRAETDRETAYRINCEAPGYLAAALVSSPGRLIHISTDYVFDGALGRPYRADDSPRPLNVYGETKLGGERRVLDVLDRNALVIRTSWLYSSHGHNFVNTMIALMRDREEVRVVSDQIGTPTWARALAQTIWAALRRPEINGIHHWTDTGVASWYEFAVAIQQEALACGLLTRETRLVPVSSDEYPAVAVRPSYSVLEPSGPLRKFGAKPAYWRDALRSVMLEIPVQ